MSKLAHKSNKKIWLKYLGIYTLAFCLCALLAFSPFIISQKSLIGVDGWRQHYIAFIYFGNYCRDIIKNIFVNHTFAIPQWDFSIGLGADVLQTLNYYVIGDPLSLLSVVTPEKYAYVAYNFLVLFRLYLAGIAFFAYANYKRKHSFTSLLVGSLTYVFFAYVFINAVAHPFFANPMIYFPLVLLGVEKIFDGKKPYLLTIMVFVCAVSNFYFFYMIAFLTILYVLFRMFHLYTFKTIKPATKTFLQIAIASLTGLLMSAVILVPVIIGFFSDSRVSSNYNLGLFYDVKYFKSLLLSYVQAVDLAGCETYLGFSCIGIVGIFLLFCQKKKHKQLKVGFVVCTLFLVTPIFAHIINGFSYVTNRWIWAYGLLIGYIVATTFEYLKQIDKKTVIKLFLVLAVYFVICFAVNGATLTANYLINFALAVAIVIVSIINIKIKGKDIANVVVVLLVIASIGINGYCLYNQIDGDFMLNYIDMSEVEQGFDSDLTEQVKNSTKDDTEFHRYTNKNETFYFNRDLISKTYSTSFYWSLENSNISDFLTEMEMPNTYIFRYQNFNNRADINSMLSVKYFYTDDETDTMYGYNAYDNNIYKTDYSLPLGYSYDKCISREDYDKLSAIEKQQAILQGVVVEDSSDLDSADLSFSQSNVDYTIDTGSDIYQQGDKFYVYEENAELIFNFDGEENSETYLELTIDDYVWHSDSEYYTTHVDDPLNRYSQEAWNNLSKQEQEDVENNLSSKTFTTSIEALVSSKSDSKEYATQSVNVLSDYDVKYDGRNKFLLNTGYSDEAKTSITITFLDKGVYTLKDISVICENMDNLSSEVDTLRQDSLENACVGVNTVSGTVTFDKTKMLCLSIPYSDGWTAYVDGEEVDTQRVNTMLVGIEIGEGTHDIKLVYSTPYLKESLCITAIGFGLFVIEIVLFGKKKHPEP